MIEDKNIDTPTVQKPHSGGTIFERRFIIYDKMKLSVKAIDFIIIFCVILLFVFFILGVYIK